MSTTTLCPHCRQELTWLPLNGIEIPTNTASVRDPNAKKFDIEQGHKAHFETCKLYRDGALKNNSIGVAMVERLREPEAQHDPGDETDSIGDDQPQTDQPPIEQTNGDNLQQPAEAETRDDGAS